MVCLPGNKIKHSSEKIRSGVTKGVKCYMTKFQQIGLIDYLVANGWESDGETFSERYRLITKKSYPLAGAEVTTGGKPRLRKNGWKIGVGARTTVLYRRPENPETITGTDRMAGRRVMTFQDWEMYNFNTREPDQIKAKLKELGLV